MNERLKPHGEGGGRWRSRATRPSPCSPTSRGDPFLATGIRLDRLLRLLQGAIRAAGRTQTQVDARIGRRRGYLSHVFQHRVDLKVRDLLGALEVLGVDPRRFFGAVFSRRGEDRAGIEELIDLLAAGRGGRVPSAAGLATAEGSSQHSSETELLDRVREAVRAVLAEWPGGPGGGVPLEDVSSAKGSEELKPRSGGGCVLP